MEHWLEREIAQWVIRIKPFPKIFFSSLQFKFSVLSLEWIFVLFAKISQNYTDLKRLLNIKVLTQQVKWARAIATYCSWKISVNIIFPPALWCRCEVVCVVQEIKDVSMTTSNKKCWTKIFSCSGVPDPHYLFGGWVHIKYYTCITHACIWRMPRCDTVLHPCFFWV